MEIKKGMRVALIDDVLEGTVTEVRGNLVTFKTDDGFKEEAWSHELVVDSGETYDITRVTDEDELPKLIREKEGEPKKKPISKRHSRLSRKVDMEVDLHIHQLVDIERGLNSHDKLRIQVEHFERKMHFALQNNLHRVVFIHGVGAGVLKHEICRLLDEVYHLEHFDAAFQKYGFGATEVLL
ncbi:MAG: Smr/MutS family protein [Flavobacteriales bacterium]|nr:Smr/MutS family protein [Flavobacteriales bacterium]